MARAWTSWRSARRCGLVSIIDSCGCVGNVRQRINVLGGEGGYEPKP
jgi:hypothetical protein